MELSLPGVSLPKNVLSFLATVTLTYLVLLLSLRFFEKQLIFFPNYPGRLAGDWKPAGLEVEEVWLRAADGIRLHAWWISGSGAEFTFVVFHGNAGNISHRAEVYGFLRDLPANVLAMEYRGYGRSEGVADEEGFYRDAEAAHDYLVKERGIEPRRIIPFGQSLGSAIAADLASKQEVGGAVLEAPFGSAKAVARRVYWFLPGLGFVVKSRFETAEKLARVRAPVLVVHCADDPVIAFSLGEEVYRQARDPKIFFRVNGYCHEEASLVAPAQYRAQLQKFLLRLRQ